MARLRENAPDSPDSPAAARPLAGVLAAGAANLLVAWVTWRVLPDGPGDLSGSEFGDWLRIVAASGLSWSVVGLALAVGPRSRPLGLALLGGVALAAAVCAGALLTVAVAAGS